MDHPNGTLRHRQPGPAVHYHHNQRHHQQQHRHHPVPPSPPVRTQEEVEGILQTLQEETGYKSEQQHRVRRLLRQSSQGEAAMVQQRRCEIFIGRLPKDLLEDELFKMCSPFGEILEIRLMLHAECALWNRGFAFVVFSREAEAQAAIEKLDRSEIRPGMRIGVKRSVDNCRLFMGSLPRDKTKEDFETEIRKLPACAETMRKVIMYPAVQDRTKNRGFAFVEFASHREAAIARRQLMREKVQLWGKEICVDWAQPEGEVEQDVMNQVRIVYVRNLNMETTEETLLEIFSTVLENGRAIEKVKKLKDFAFVHFENRSDAQRALDTLNGHVVDGSQIEVMWAKPASAKARVVQQHQEAQRRSQQDVTLNHWLIPQQAYHQANQAHIFQMNSNFRFMNGFRSILPQRHFRNAAGTRTRFGRPHGGQFVEPFEMPFGPSGYPDNFHYPHQENFTPYHPGPYYNPTVMYHNGGPTTPPMPHPGSPAVFHYNPHHHVFPQHTGYQPQQQHQNHLPLEEQVSNLTTTTQVTDDDDDPHGHNGLPPLDSTATAHYVSGPR
ncbi:APOBEC1 complementation factor [Hypsibius exemplaris]|uniref:APOBEC1 complementation factor n=1 Tax=Hypsibius exemplaris TaxID=2072580 RepID=A0A1W0WKP2_HYPEX|nr:APOBEC1 complementation factor [Hypsibius exemplaris]